MSSNPLDDSGSFCVLLDDEEQRNLWPTSADTPTGWWAV